MSTNTDWKKIALVVSSAGGAVVLYYFFRKRGGSDAKPSVDQGASGQLGELAWWNSPDWLTTLREAQSCSVPGPSVIDLKEETILTYAVGEWRMIDRDLHCAFAPELVERLEQCFQDHVRSALAVRRELINYKKLCLHLWQAALTIEKDLRQLTSFFYCDLLTDNTAERKARYLELSSVMNECRGVVAALHDARYYGKTICNLKRHPDSGVPWKLEELPQSLEVWRPLEQANQFLNDHPALDEYFAARWAHWKNSSAEKTVPQAEKTGGSLATEGDDAKIPKISKPGKKDLRWKSERELVDSPLCRDGLRNLLASVEAAGLNLPQNAFRYVELVLIARGASKALAIKSSLLRYNAALQSVADEINDAMSRLDDVRKSNASETMVAAGLHLHAQKHWHVLKGMSIVVPEMLRWLLPIGAAQADTSRLFVSGTRNAATFVPPGFADLLGPYKAMVKKHRDAMLKELGETGWPKSARLHQDDVNLHRCSRCKDQYTKLWLHRELCFSCEESLRNEGVCPYTKKCGSRSFCKHERRCIVCEQWSCQACSLLRGDGEDVWQVVGQIQPSVIFLDFDRTLATTKAGASPLVGHHSVDEDLAVVCRGHACVQVVTRSSRHEDIEKFLVMKDVPVSKVRSLKREGKRTKADIIVEEMNLHSGLGLFVDDDIRELTEPELQPLVDQGRLHRLLFVRAGGKE